MSQVLRMSPPSAPSVPPGGGLMKRRRASSDVVFEPILRSPAMRRLDRMLRTLAPKEVGVSLVGESGTGKEILARRIHDLSPRRTGPFVPINCAAVPEALFESELFGHEKGSFTGATELMRGKLEPAHGGTLFLDEIGDMPLSAQGKLLRFLENQKFMRVGGATKISVDVRVVCATLRPLEEEIAQGRFRGDLYYRIQGIKLEVPPLRERQADLRPLIEQLLSQLGAKHGTLPVRMSRAALAALRRYAWPGNIRELRNVLELVALLRAGKLVRVEDLPTALRQASLAPNDPSPESPVASRARSSIEVPLDQPLRESQAQIIAAVLEREAGNRSRAAQQLGISVRTIQRHLFRIHEDSHS
jgi:DNA-binding NtrC family response regulator